MLYTIRRYAEPYIRAGEIDAERFYPVAAELFGVDPDDRPALGDVVLDETGQKFVDAASRDEAVFRAMRKRFTLDELRDDDRIRDATRTAYETELRNIAHAWPNTDATLPEPMLLSLCKLVDIIRNEHITMVDVQTEADTHARRREEVERALERTKFDDKLITTSFTGKYAKEDALSYVTYHIPNRSHLRNAVTSILADTAVNITKPTKTEIRAATALVIYEHANRVHKHDSHIADYNVYEKNIRNLPNYKTIDEQSIKRALDEIPAEDKSKRPWTMTWT